ncbi:hypothetical protein ABGB18_07980 [Nonomuraea sp. B12E4]|uniref:hypothetical protein n=1 Tax=Nonomuraea sp. B12E4 TaxID=3153564 RepID=UPI00325D093C
MIIVRHPAQPPSGRTSQFPKRMTGGYPRAGHSALPPSYPGWVQDGAHPTRLPIPDVRTQRAGP